MAKKKAQKAEPAISMNSHWNVPAWQDASAYPKPDDLSLPYWRWEFIRRRQDYREDFDTHAAPTYEYERAQAKKENRSAVPPDHPAFRASLLYLAVQRRDQPDPAFHQALLRLLRYDLAHSGLPNPRCMTPTRLHFERPFGAFLEGPVNDKTPLFLREDQVMFTYCLSRPLPPQEKLIGDLLRKMQAHRFRKKVARRARVKAWPVYLRVLDAKAAGVPLHEIGKTVLKLSGMDKEIAIRVLQDIYQPAYELGVNFPN